MFGYYADAQTWGREQMESDFQVPSAAQVFARIAKCYRERALPFEAAFCVSRDILIFGRNH
jgi:hypothetical protein